MSTKDTCKILMVDDEPNVLSGYARTVGRNFDLIVAEGGAAAMGVMGCSGPFGVVITDMRMPNMTGLQFIEAARVVSKESVFMMLTGNADQQTAVDAINRGHIFRFLNKPCAPELLDVAIRAGIRQHELITAERVLLRETFTGSIKLLSDALGLTSPFLASLQNTVKQMHLNVCVELGITRDWQTTVASSLCLIGLVTMPGLNLSEAISDESLDLAATLGHRLIKNLPRLEPVANMILHQRDFGPLPLDLKSTEAAVMEVIGAQLLRFCVDTACAHRRLGSLTLALAEMKGSGAYDKRLIAALQTERFQAALAGPDVVRELPIPQLETGMKVEGDIRGTDGTLILSNGQPLTDLSIASLHNYAQRKLIGPRIKVRASATILAKAA